LTTFIVLLVHLLKLGYQQLHMPWLVTRHWNHYVEADMVQHQVFSYGWHPLKCWEELRSHQSASRIIGFQLFHKCTDLATLLQHRVHEFFIADLVWQGLLTNKNEQKYMCRIPHNPYIFFFSFDHWTASSLWPASPSTTGAFWSASLRALILVRPSKSCWSSSGCSWTLDWHGGFGKMGKYTKIIYI
jgi:hypothetical protein